MKILIVANPVAGGRGKGRGVRRLAEHLEARGHEVELYWTRGRGDAAKRVRALPDDLDRIVVAGGDGTLNEVLNGLKDPARIPVALLPLGTANMLVRELGLPWRPLAVARHVESSNTRLLDLGLIGERRFLCVASVGFDAMVTEVIERTRKGRRLGFRGYLRPLVSVLRCYRAPHLEILVDDQAPLTGSLVIVGNIRNYGGFFSFTDRAQADSGVLDVCVLPASGAIPVLRYLWLGLLGRVAQRREVLYRTGRSIRIRASEPVAMQVDGDFAGQTPVEIRVVPQAVRFLVP